MIKFVLSYSDRVYYLIKSVVDWIIKHIRQSDQGHCDSDKARHGCSREAAQMRFDWSMPIRITEWTLDAITSVSRVGTDSLITLNIYPWRDWKILRVISEIGFP